MLISRGTQNVASPKCPPSAGGQDQHHLLQRHTECHIPQVPGTAGGQDQHHVSPGQTQTACWKWADCARACFMQTRSAGAIFRPPLHFTPPTNTPRQTWTRSQIHTHANPIRASVFAKTHPVWTAGWLSGGRVRIEQNRC